MTLDLECLALPGPYGDIETHVARPAAKPPYGGIVLLHEGVGVTAQLLGVARRLAAEGYQVVVPDLYCRDPNWKGLTPDDLLQALPIARARERDQRISALTPAQRERALAVIRWFDARQTTQYAPDVEAVIAHLRRDATVRSSAIAALGFSLGGGVISALADRGADLAAGVVYYGLPPAPESVSAIRFALQFHCAATDPAVNSKMPAFIRAFAATGRRPMCFRYDGTSHGFFNETRLVYDPSSAELAWRRTLEFLRVYIGASQPAPSIASSTAGLDTSC